jgi:hypothetical protein
VYFLRLGRRPIQGLALWRAVEQADHPELAREPPDRLP